jgi:hypothetical protein
LTGSADAGRGEGGGGKGGGEKKRSGKERRRAGEEGKPGRRENGRARRTVAQGMAGNGGDIFGAEGTAEAEKAEKESQLGWD